MKKTKNIWVFHHYATPPTMNGAIRPYNLAKKILEEGYRTTIFSASYLHFSDENLIHDNQLYVTDEHTGVKFVFVKTPSSSKGITARIKNMLAYYINVQKAASLISKQGAKPDIIYASSPHPLALIAGIKVAKKFKVPCISEIRDLWPENIFAFGKIKENSLIGKLLTKGEYWIYKKSDRLVFLKEGDTDYLKEHGWLKDQGGDINIEKCFYINNGVDIESFNKQSTTEVFSDPDLENDKFKVVYTGAIRPVNNVGNILDAAKLLKNYDKIQFLIYGDGNQLASLKERIKVEGIRNVFLKGYIDKKFIPYILSKSSVNILNYSQSKYNWSRGNSSNKLFEYMASGKPIISTVKMGYSPIETYNCGLSIDEDTPTELANAILKIYEIPEDSYKQMGENALRGALNFDYKILSKRLINVIENT